MIESTCTDFLASWWKNSRLTDLHKTEYILGYILETLVLAQMYRCNFLVVNST